VTASGQSFARSVDGGATFSPSPPAFVLGEFAVVDKCDNVTTIGTVNGGFVAYQRSTDGGVTFSPPAKISDLSGDFEEQITIDKNGNVHIVWGVDGPRKSNTCESRLPVASIEDGGGGISNRWSSTLSCTLASVSPPCTSLMRFFRFPRFGDWSSCERRRRADVDAKKCDENCDGSSDFAAKTETIDRFQLNRISKLSVINARSVHPAYRLARYFLRTADLRGSC
jgi:hypothetical protein